MPTELEYQLKHLKAARELISQVIRDENDTGIFWLTNTRHAAGSLDTAIHELEKWVENPEKAAKKNKYLNSIFSEQS